MKLQRSANKAYINANKAYISLIRSSLEYCAAVWDPYLIKDISILEGIWRRAAMQIRHPGSQSFYQCILITKGSELDLS